MATRTYESIASQTLGSAAASITFSSIPATFTDLRLVLTFTTSVAGTQATVIFNNDSATNYSDRELNANGTAASSTAVQNLSGLYLGESRATGSSATIPGIGTLDILQYKNTGMFKTCLIQNFLDLNGSGGIQEVVGLWRSTTAITSIKLTPASNFNTGTTAELIGIL